MPPEEPFNEPPAAGSSTQEAPCSDGRPEATATELHSVSSGSEPAVEAGGSTQAASQLEPPAIAPANTATLQAMPMEARLLLTALTYFLIGASLGGAVWQAFYGDLAAHVARNSMLRPQRDFMIGTMAVSGVVSVLVPGVVLLLRKTAERFRSVERAARVLAPLMLAFFLPMFFDWRVFRAHELLFVIVATIFGVLLERAFRLSFSEFRFERFDERLARLAERYPRATRRAPLVAVGALSAFFCVYFSYFTVLQHLRLQTTSWDMAIFDNLMWNLIRGEWFKASPVLGPTGSHIQYHATFIAYVFAPFYALYQKPETLLVLQASLAGLGAVPLFLIAQRRLHSAIGAFALACAYVLHAPLHGPIFYDFHFITTAPFWVGWVLYFYETERKGWLIATWALAFLVREEVSASLSMVALFYLLSGKRPRWAIAGGIASVLYFFVVKFGIMPLHRTQGPDKQTFAWIFQALIPPGESGLNGVIRTLITNPAFALSSLLESDKLVYVLKTFGPLLLLPLRDRLTWILFVPAAIFTLLSTGYKPLIETYFQYTSNYTPYLFFAAAVALGKMKWQAADGRVKAAAALAAVLITATVFSYNQGAILQHNNFRGGFQQVRFDRTESDQKRYAQLYELIAMIPPRATVTATEMEAAHVSQRPDCFTMRFGHGDAEYLLVSLDEASWGDSRTHLTAALNTGKYGFVAARGRFALWSKKAGHEKDNEGRRLLGLPAKP